MDEIDKKLIIELQKDSRLSHYALGKLLGVTEGTIRRRIRNLKK